MKDLFIRIFTLIAALFTSRQWGKTEVKKDQAETNVKDLKEDAKIDAEPYVDNPLSRMRRKK